MPHEARLHGLYVITDADLCMARGIENCVAEALRGGARIVQYRDKSSDSNRRLQESRALVELCKRHNALLLINDDVQLALASGAHGVHLGRDDAAISEARTLLGGTALIGYSCYDDFSRAERAAAAGADYVAFGSVFASRVKPDAVRAPLALFEQARSNLPIPACAIGGIDAGNIRNVVTAGANMAAVISAVFAADDIAAAAGELSQAFRDPHPAPAR